MKILLDYPVLYPEKDYPNSVVRMRNRGMSEAEIIAFKSYINNIRYNGVAGAPFNFQKALEEFLFLAGKHCFGLTNEHGVCAELFDFYFHLLK